MRRMIMTFKELRDQLNELDEDQLDCEVDMYDESMSVFFNDLFYSIIVSDIKYKVVAK